MSIDVSVTTIPNDDIKDEMAKILESDQIGTRTKPIFKRLIQNLRETPIKEVVEDNQFIAVDIAMAKAGLDAMTGSIAVINDMGSLDTEEKKEEARTAAEKFRIGLRQVASGMYAVSGTLRRKMTENGQRSLDASEERALGAIEEDVFEINEYAISLDYELQEREEIDD